MKRLAHFSQHFLRKPQLVKELIGHTTITKNDIVYDIGAGSGTVSSALAERCKAVIAIEVDPRMVEKLRDNLRKYPNVSVQAGDIMEFELPNGPYKIFANIPFHLSSAIVRKITQAPNPPEATYLVVQKQFANKLLPDSDRFTSQLGMMIGPEFAVRIRRRLLRTDFWPHPNVDTVLLEIIHRPEPLIEESKMPAFRKFIEDCFSDPKKFAKISKTKIGITPEIKASQLKLAQWIILFSGSVKR